jgi:hypothetical protein
VIKSREISWAEHVAHMEEEERLYRVVVSNPEGKTALGKLRHWWSVILTF